LLEKEQVHSRKRNKTNIQLNWKCKRKKERINKFNTKNKFKEEETQKQLKISKFFIMNLKYLYLIF